MLPGHLRRHASGVCLFRRFRSINKVRSAAVMIQWAGNTLRDLRFALRSWRQTPTFAIAAIATLAIGIGANAAIFSVISGVLLRPLPFVDPQTLVQLYETQPRNS